MDKRERDGAACERIPENGMRIERRYAKGRGGETGRGAREKGKLRVAAYIRVSTEFLSQEESLERQERYFSHLIQSREDWSYAGIYSDWGITGTGKEGRLGFRRLLQSCEEGRIDRILCKSISRFTRNTEDLLEAVRILSRRHVSILFEKENIDTAEPVNEFVLTTLAALAQEESRSMSENIKGSIRMRFSRGEVFFRPIYGYRVCKSYDEYGHVVRDVVIEPEEARVVRYIYRRVLEGAAFAQVARELNTRLIPYPVRQQVTRGRKGERESPDCGWSGPRVRQILDTERYTGDSICQKTYTRDVLGQDGKNTGQAPRYLVRGSHPPIISHEEYEKVQAMLLSRKRGDGHARREYPLSGRVVCGVCGRIYHMQSMCEDYQIWQCPLSAYNSSTRLVCDEPALYDVQLYRAIRKGFSERFSMLEFVKGEGLLREEGQKTEKTRRFGTGSLSAAEFLEQMMKRFEPQNLYGKTEEDRAYLKRKLMMTGYLEQQYKKRYREAQAVYNTMVLTAKEQQKERLEPLSHAVKQCRGACERIAGERLALLEEAEQMERYWLDLDRDYECRKRALAWLRGLPKSRDGILELMRGLSGWHLRAWVMKITVQSPFCCEILWYDNVRSQVTLPDNLGTTAELREYESLGWIW